MCAIKMGNYTFPKTAMRGPKLTLPMILDEPRDVIIL